VWRPSRQRARLVARGAELAVRRRRGERPAGDHDGGGARHCCPDDVPTCGGSTSPELAATTGATSTASPPSRRSGRLGLHERRQADASGAVTARLSTPRGSTVDLPTRAGASRRVGSSSRAVAAGRAPSEQPRRRQARLCGERGGVVVGRGPQGSVSAWGRVTGSIASGVKRTLWRTAASITDLGTGYRTRSRGPDDAGGFAAMAILRRGAATCSTLAPRRLANVPNPSQRTCRSARACAGWHTMSEAPADAPSEPVVWLSWPTICTRSRERSVVIIDLAPIDEDEVTRRVSPDTITTCGSFAQARCPHRRHEQIGHCLTGRVRVQRHRRVRRVEAALHPANDPTAIIREEV